MKIVLILSLALLAVDLTMGFMFHQQTTLRSASSLHSKRRSNISKSKSASAPAAPTISMDPAKKAAAASSSMSGTAEESPFVASSMENIVESVGGVSASYEQQVKSSINADMDALNSRLMEVADQRKESTQKENGIIAKSKDILSLVLVADFFVIIFFLVWFLAAAATKDSNPFLLERFQDIFQPIVVPSLTVLMAGSIASGVTGNKDDDQ